MKSYQKTLSAMSHDFIMTVICFYLSIALRYESIDPSTFTEISNIWTYIGLSSISKFSVFYFFGLYMGIWRFASTPDLIRIIKAVSAAVSVSTLLLFLIFRLEGLPRSSIFIDWTLLIITLGGGRFTYRILRDKLLKEKNVEGTLNIFIIGAGVAGEQLLRAITTNPSLKINVVAFIDDDKHKTNKTLHGIKILGTTDELPLIFQEKNIDQVFIAIPSATGKQIKKIVEKCQPLGIKVKTLPKMSDIISGHIDFSLLRNINLEDLLGRKEIFLNQKVIQSMIEGNKVLVSGAGGSIGSELIVQIVKFAPGQLYLVDISEINLFNLKRKIDKLAPNNQYQFIISDIRDFNTLESIIDNAQPDIILHAAAYKHVPLMETNPIQAIRTNILGTNNMAKLAVKYKVGKFVLVSTDKAVNPTNIMGTSKRIAEILCQEFQRVAQSTHFITVRFGNVLGSSGSVIPIFKEQILNGGPVTVTHPNIQRFFMSIPEASQLILQAATLGNGGEIFVLDMGAPVKILDIAKQLINLANLKEGTDLEIKFTGLRPGEKLFEELLADKETTLATSHPLVRTAKSLTPTQKTVGLIYELISSSSSAMTNQKIRELLMEIVPEYDPDQLQNLKFGKMENIPDGIH